MSDCLTLRLWPAIRLALLVAGWFSVSLMARADWQDDVGYAKLEASLGDQIPTGQGVFIAQTEAEYLGVAHEYHPDPNSYHFNASLDPFGVEPTFVNGSAGAHPVPSASAHATSRVAQYYYSDVNGLAPGANTIVVYEASDYLTRISQMSCLTLA